MNDAKKLELMQKARGLFQEALTMIETREAELAKRLPASSELRKRLSQASSDIRKHLSSNGEIAELKKQNAELQESGRALLEALQKLSGTSAVGSSDREKAADMIKTIHRQGAFNIFERELRSLPAGAVNENDVVKAIKEAHQTKRLNKDELLG